MPRLRFFLLFAVTLLAIDCTLVHAKKKRKPKNYRGKCKQLENSTACAANDKCQWCDTDTSTSEGECVRNNKRKTCCKSATNDGTCTNNGPTCVWWTSSFDGGVTTVGECKDVKCKHIYNETICASDEIPYCGWQTTDECVRVRPGMW